MGSNESAFSKEPHPEAQRFIKDGRLNRTIPQAVKALGDLLRSTEEGEVSAETRKAIAENVLELEVYEHGLLAYTVPQHEVGAFRTHYSIRRAVSDARLRALGIISQLASFSDDKALSAQA